MAAIAGVVFIHSASGLVTSGTIRGSAMWWVGTSLSLGSSWSVPIFIMVSGALLLRTRREESARRFYAKRLQRIAVPLVVAHVGYFAVRAVLLHEQLTAQIMIRDLMLARVYPQLYFFWIIIGLYLVTPLLRTALGGRTRRELIVIGAAGLGFMWAVHAASAVMIGIGRPVSVWQPAALVLWIPYLGYFVMGHALRDLVLSRRGMAMCLVIFAVSSAVVVWNYTTGGGPVLAALFAGGYQGLPVAISSVSLFLVARTVLAPTSRLAVSPSATSARRLGELSLGVFVIHLLVIRYAWHLPGLNASTASESLVSTILLWAVVLASSFVLCEILARIPVLRRTIGM